MNIPTDIDVGRYATDEDYTKYDPETLHSRLKGLHDSILATNRRTVADALIAGRILNAAKSRLGTGAFGKWRDAVGVREKAAEKYLAVARKWEEAKFENRPMVPVAGGSGDWAMIPEDWEGCTITEIAYPPRTRAPKVPVDKTDAELSADIYREWVGSDPEDGEVEEDFRLNPRKVADAIRSVAVYEHADRGHGGKLASAVIVRACLVHRTAVEHLVQVGRHEEALVALDRIAETIANLRTELTATVATPISDEEVDVTVAAWEQSFLPKRVRARQQAAKLALTDKNGEE